jgi:hypothetical protein
LFLYSIFETRRFIITRYFFEEKVLTLIDKKTRKSFLIKLFNSGARGINNNIDGGLSFQPDGYFQSDNVEYLTSIVSPYKLKAHISSQEFTDSESVQIKEQTKLMKFAESLNESDNQVIMVVRLKN